MKKIVKFIIMFLLMSVSNSAEYEYEFSSPFVKERFINLIKGLRCTVCKNQSLFDSSALLARDLRDEIYNLIINGNTDKSILKFLTDSYGDYILYQPFFRKDTYILWYGPFVFLIMGAFILLKKFKWK